MNTFGPQSKISNKLNKPIEPLSIESINLLQIPGIQ